MTRPFTSIVIRTLLASVIALTLFLGLMTHFTLQAHAASTKARIADSVYYPETYLTGNTNPACNSGNRWQGPTNDKNGYLEYYTRSNGSTNCAGASWSISGTPTSATCTYSLWVPSSYADITNLGVGFTSITGEHLVYHLDESRVTDGWGRVAVLADIKGVNLSNNDGYAGPDPYIGIADGDALQIVC